MKQLSLMLIASISLSSCSSLSPNGRIIFGVGSGAMIGAVGGSSLSPNEASKPWNALIFGLVGALLGGAIASLAGPHEQSHSPETRTLKDKLIPENQTELSLPANTSAPLPDFLKDRLTSLVIEEISMPSNVGEDGTLHEPHKAYRIKRAPELIPNTTEPQKMEKSK